MNARVGPAIIVVLAGTLLGVVAFLGLGAGDDDGPPDASPTTTAPAPVTTVPGAPGTSGGAPTTGAPGSTTTTLPARQPDEVPAWTVGRPWGSVRGVTMVRGHATRTLPAGRQV